MINSWITNQVKFTTKQLQTTQKRWVENLTRDGWRAKHEKNVRKESEIKLDHGTLEKETDKKVN